VVAGRRTKIIATLGPASSSERVMRALIESGADAFRLNFSFGSDQEHAAAATLARRLEAEAGRPLAVIQDLQGRKIRVGGLKTSPVAVRPGDAISLTSAAITGDASRISVNYPRLTRLLKRGDRALLGDGEVQLEVEGVTGRDVRTRVLSGGALRERMGVHFPGVALPRAAITEKDRSDLRFGLQLGFDYVALSLVRDAEDIHGLRRIAGQGHGEVQVIAKIEKSDALQSLDDILRTCDGVMVARGDLGLEVPLERVPLLQKRVIKRANARGVPVITATQMLESMIHSARPTRAEVSDVANAILDGTDSVMLSAETAVGRYPVEALQMMVRVAEETEAAGIERNVTRKPTSRARAMSRAACELAEDMHASAVVVFTRTGHSARLVSRERPSVPIIAVTPNETTWRRLALFWGVVPMLAEWPRDSREMLAITDRLSGVTPALDRGSTAVIARWSRPYKTEWTNFIRLHRLGSA
jgi:pyruvate kinase